MRYMQDDFAAKDVLQESFIKIFQNIDRYYDKGSFEGWLRKITVNTCLMAIRKQKNGFDILELSDINNRQVKPDVEFDLNEKDILKMIRQLPGQYRAIFNLFVIEGYSHAEIANLLQIKESTSRTKLSRARKLIQQIYLRNIESSIVKTT